jgi:hypothetical protein
MSERIPFIRAQRRLAVVWFLLSLATFLVVIALTVAGSFGDQSGRAWSWFLPSVIPTLTLIITAVVAEGKESPATVERFTYRLTLSASVLYLVLLLLSLLLQPIARSLGGITRMELLELSQLWLVPVHGLVGIALGVFFVSRERA